MKGLQLVLLRPEIPSCADCQSWVHDSNWKRSLRAGQPVPRKPGSPTPCHKCPKAENNRPAPWNELLGRHWRTLELYYQVQAGAPMPSDAIVRHNCGLIHWVMENIARDNLSLLPLLAVGSGRN